MSDIGFVLVFPSLHAVPACAHAVAGDCRRDGGCPCEAFQAPQGQPGDPSPEAATFWDGLACRDVPAWAHWPQAWV